MQRGHIPRASLSCISNQTTAHLESSTKNDKLLPFCREQWVVLDSQSDIGTCGESKDRHLAWVLVDLLNDEVCSGLLSSRCLHGEMMSAIVLFKLLLQSKGLLRCCFATK